MMRSAVLIGVLGLAAALGGCYSAGAPVCHAGCTAYPAAYAPSPAYPTPWDDPFADYSRRIVTVSPSAGNTQAANLALQTATPWPRHSNDTNIPASGPVMVRAIHEYDSGIVPPLPSLGSAGGSAGGGTATNTSGGGSSAPPAAAGP